MTPAARAGFIARSSGSGQQLVRELRDHGHSIRATARQTGSRPRWWSYAGVRMRSGLEAPPSRPDPGEPVAVGRGAVDRQRTEHEGSAPLRDEKDRKTG